ncbi:MAG: MarR family winged helix-turn-helix transcriptional regulator [Bacillota bacterium]
MAKLFIQTLPTHEELKQSASELYPEIEADSLYTHLLFRKVATDIEAKFDSFFAQYQLSPGRYTLLILLRKAPNGLMPSELAQKVGVTQATISGLINSLEKAELVARETHSKDGRAFVIKLTTKGHSLIKSLAPEYYSRLKDFWGEFSASEKAQLKSSLELMISNMDKLRMK